MSSNLKDFKRFISSIEEDKIIINFNVIGTEKKIGSKPISSSMVMDDSEKLKKFLPSPKIKIIDGAMLWKITKEEILISLEAQLKGFKDCLEKFSISKVLDSIPSGKGDEVMFVFKSFSRFLLDKEGSVFVDPEDKKLCFTELCLKLLKRMIDDEATSAIIQITKIERKE